MYTCLPLTALSLSKLWSEVVWMLLLLYHLYFTTTKMQSASKSGIFLVKWTSKGRFPHFSTPFLQAVTLSLGIKLVPSVFFVLNTPFFLRTANCQKFSLLPSSLSIKPFNSFWLLFVILNILSASFSRFTSLPTLFKWSPTYLHPKLKECVFCNFFVFPNIFTEHIFPQT